MLKKDRAKLTKKNNLIRRSKRYSKWRLSIFQRDDFICQLCYTKSRKKHKVILNAHHIKKFSSYPKLRFNKGNGITLCLECHKSIRGKEEEYEQLFRTKIKQNTLRR